MILTQSEYDNEIQNGDFEIEEIYCCAVDHVIRCFCCDSPMQIKEGFVKFERTDTLEIFCGDCVTQ